ncbi:pyridoxal phosphate-dependent aminotransferase [Cognatishimia sp. F0-27]|uniref:pyridoxal phosphate-dependent aminotransferase n=1 Tax=Cognatishimia sp. F0-27 TaxID=2816855 RepID=UPI001D0C915C|nr:aminotransferase class I/II-fold pyridoxal phosphate-dependent enzyme [Cognatishimia sp. F0-27]MCC1493429.1 aminotransferase class I/II-fold pyridoxal phosphate-dependent enzyme [Cognatishimia sp. F0-27]
MPGLSSRLTGMNDGGSDGWEVFYRARALVASGQPVTELTIGEHDISTDARILDALDAAARGGHTGYAMVPGVDALRDAIAARVQDRTGVATGRDNVLVTPGGQSALFSAHMAACAPGDTALFIDPFYATYPGTIRAASAIARPVSTRAATGFLPDPATVARLARETGAKSLLINTPNNPTGAVYPEETLRGLASVCVEHDLWLISDEVYDTQVWSGTHLSPRALPGMAARTMVIGSMSKSHAMTGSRIGWIVAPEPAIAALIDLATATTYGVPGYIQDAALFALTDDTALETRVAAPFRRRRDLVLDRLSRQSIVTAIPAQGAMYLMLDIRATGLSGRAFAEALLDAHHIAVMPGESFGTSAAGHLRVALTVEDSRLSDAIDTLCAFAARHACAA